MSAKYFFKLGMHPLAPRWFKVWCLKMILRHVMIEMQKAVDKMSSQQRQAYDEAMAKSGKLGA